MFEIVRVPTIGVYTEILAMSTHSHEPRDDVRGSSHRQKYEAPQIVEYGTLRDLTLGAFSLNTSDNGNSSNKTS